MSECEPGWTTARCYGSPIQIFLRSRGMINFFQTHQASPLIYILENTYPGERCTPAVQNAANLVESFIGAPVVVDAADLGAAAHRVRLF